MAAFATVHGVTLPIAKKAWRLAPQILGGSDDRADDGTLVSGQTARKRDWDTSFHVGTEAEREAFRRLVEGDGLHVDFDDASGFAWSGLGPKTATSVTYDDAGGKRGGRAIIGSTGALEYALAEVMQQQDGSWGATKGWTLAVFKRVSGSWVDHLATGAVVVVRGESTNPTGVTQYQDGVAAPTAGMGEWIDVADDGDVGIYGYDEDGAGAAFAYDELLVLPFSLPASTMATWAAQLAAYRASYAVGRLPRVQLGGECIASDGAPLEVRCRVTRIENEPMFLEGAYQKNARIDDVTVREV
jgi:hypothetical protein